MIGILHTWGRNLSYHPHIHYLVPAGGLADDRKIWLPARRNFLLPVKALSKLFRAKFRDALRKETCFDDIPPSVWKKDWVVHCQSVSTGEGAIKYLAPYIFRVAISNNRILRMVNGKVTFRYKDTGTGKTRLCTLLAEEFIRRFLQHVLPKGFVKIRYYGLFSPGLRQQLIELRNQLIIAHANSSLSSDVTDQGTQVTDQQSSLLSLDQIVPCPSCGQSMLRKQIIRPKGRCPPLAKTLFQTILPTLFTEALL